MALRPDEFLRLTPLEFTQLLDGWRWRDDQQKRQLAYAITWLVNPHLKKKVDFDKIYNPLIGADEIARRKAKDHREIIRDRRRKSTGVARGERR